MKFEASGIQQLKKVGSNGWYVGRYQDEDIVVRLFDSFKEARQFIETIYKLKDTRAYPNVATFMGICTNPLYIVTEYPKGSMSLSDKNLGEMALVELRVQVCEGLSHLHSNDILCHELNASCICVTPKSVWVKMLDINKVMIVQHEASITAMETYRLDVISFRCDLFKFVLVVVAKINSHALDWIAKACAEEKGHPTLEGIKHHLITLKDKLTFEKNEATMEM